MFFKPTSIRQRLLPALLAGALALSAGCNVTKYLDDSRNERLLIQNKLKIEPAERMRYAERSALNYEISGLLRQRPNERTLYLFRTRLSLHYRFRDRKGGFARWINNKVAERPVLYDPAVTERTVNNLRAAMRQRGYFNAQCRADTLPKGPRKMRVVYTLSPGKPYRIDTVSFVSKDEVIRDWLFKNKHSTLLKPGLPADSRLFEGEKSRITAGLKDNGFAFFTPGFIEFGGDSARYKVNIEVEVLQPGDSLAHSRHVLGAVYVFDKLTPDLINVKSDTTLGGVYFASADTAFSVKAARLYDALVVRPGVLFRQRDFDQTISRLNGLGVFSIVSVRPVQDSVNPQLIQTVISLTPNKRVTRGYDIDLNQSTSSISGQLLGVSAGVFLRNRNVWRGAENMQNNLNYNVEIDLVNRNRLIFSQEFKFQNDLLIPRFFDYLGFWRNFNRVRWGKGHVIPDYLYQKMRSEGQTRITLGYNRLSLTAFYSYDLFNASLGYDIQADAERSYTFDHIGIDVLRPSLKPLFDSLFGQNAFLKLSFGNQLFTGLILRSFNYSYFSLPNRFGERWFMRLGAEMSGLEVLGAESLSGLLGGPKSWTIGGLDFAKYGRLQIEGGYLRDFNNRGLVGALRVVSGIASPFGNTPSTPYVKQFFAGGPTSLRAWRIRQIGPGGYFNAREASVQPFFQAADFQLEMNAELRFPLFSWFKGAVFIDAGNIWALKADPKRPGAELRWDSYKNIAIGTGFGIRADFSYFVFRLDWGLKLRRPFRAGPLDYWVERPFDRLFKRLTPNIAVGYPF